MAEEQRWQEPGSHRLCANKCGFLGSPTTLHLCSKCYKDYCMKEQQMKDAHTVVVEKTIRQSESQVPPPFAFSISSLVVQTESTTPVTQLATESSATAKPNRCSACRKRVGLIGFTCRCGATFCGSHRYPEKHGCGFDYKALGREAIAKANPVIKAKKLDKI